MPIFKNLIKSAMLRVIRLIEPHCDYYLGRSNPFNPFINPIVGVRTPQPCEINAEEVWAFGMDKIQIGLTQLISKEVYQQKLEGAIAEVGVFRGINASVLNYFFPDRRLFLFDTFEGFDPRDIEIENGLGFEVSEYPGRTFTKTNTGLVMSRLSHKENIIIRKGWFPESAIGLEDETFCYVFLDANLYHPIYKGLHWFYERLTSGGYIVVDLYNWEEYPGPKKAVCDFSKEIGINYIPIPDRTGCVVFCKPLS